MQTRQYKDLFALSTHLIGATALTADEQTQLSTFIDRRFFEAFRKSPIWPRYMVYGEPRRIASLAIEDASVSGGHDVNGVYYFLGSVTGTGVQPNTNAFYKSTANESHNSIVGSIIYKNTTPAWVVATSATVTKNADGTFVVSNTGTARLTEADLEKKESPADVEVWTLGSDINAAPGPIFKGQFIPYIESATSSDDIGRDQIGDFIRIHKTQPFLDRSAFEYDFYADEDGAHIKNLGNSEQQKAFVTYKKPFSTFGVTSSFTTSTVEVPEEFFNYIAHAAYADFLTMQGKVELAQTESIVAEKYLEIELEKLNNINSTNTLSRISTHLSRQRRK